MDSLHRRYFLGLGGAAGALLFSAACSSPPAATDKPKNTLQEIAPLQATTDQSIPPSNSLANPSSASEGRNTYLPEIDVVGNEPGQGRSTNGGGPLLTNDNSTDVVFSKAYIEEKIADAKRGRMDYTFAKTLVALADRDAVKGTESGRLRPGWLQSARENYTSALRLYKAADADPTQIVMPLIHLGRVAFYLSDLDFAEKRVSTGTDVLGDMIENGSKVNSELNGEYALGLGTLARIYRMENKMTEARLVLDKALTFARDHLGEDSAEFQALKQTDVIIREDEKARRGR